MISATVKYHGFFYGPDRLSRPVLLREPGAGPWGSSCLFVSGDDILNRWEVIKFHGFKPPTSDGKMESFYENSVPSGYLT